MMKPAMRGTVPNIFTAPSALRAPVAASSVAHLTSRYDSRRPSSAPVEAAPSDARAGAAACSKRGTPSVYEPFRTGAGCLDPQTERPYRGRSVLVLADDSATGAFRPTGRTASHRLATGAS